MAWAAGVAQSLRAREDGQNKLPSIHLWRQSDFRREGKSRTAKRCLGWR
jgi:hypothetical protein